MQGWQVAQVRFYTGVHTPEGNQHWHRFWAAKLIQMSRQGVKTFWRPLSLPEHEHHGSPDGREVTATVGQEKGIDVRIALDVVSFVLNGACDVVLIFSQDQDLSEVTDESAASPAARNAGSRSLRPSRSAQPPATAGASTRRTGSASTSRPMTAVSIPVTTARSCDPCLAAARYNAGMTPPATKGEKLFLLAAAVLAVAAALLAPASAEASRYLPQALEPVTAPPASLEDLAASDVDHHPALPALTAADRLDLVDLAAGARLEAQRLGLHLASGELGAARKTASGGQTWVGEDNVRPISEMGVKTRRPTFQGLWTDPVTGLGLRQGQVVRRSERSLALRGPPPRRRQPRTCTRSSGGDRTCTPIPLGLELRWFDSVRNRGGCS